MVFSIMLIVCGISGYAQTSVSPSPCVDHFFHGVASGDPLPDGILLWTRITPDDFGSAVNVSYKVALDTGMVNIVTIGSVTTDAAKDFTVKADVTGLQPDTYYYYEFSGLGSNSPRGRTKTAPTSGVDQLRFAVVSCANLEAGYFNAYSALVERNDVEAVLMLGDYIYEYEEGGYGQNPNVDRVFDPTHETVSLSDYRLRYSVYHMDHSLQKLHQNFPWICVWDDHESANNSFEGGAQNHNAGEGAWADRKLAAQQAYFEWLPIRPKQVSSYEIFRKFSYGPMLDLFMVDTRLHGRDEQGVNQSDPNRSILGSDQYQWLTDELNQSASQWKVLGNQVIFAPVTVFGIPINDDAWDGYPAERNAVLDHVRDNSIDNFTIITGDVHTSWAFDLERSNDHVGVEFVTPSVTSPGVPLNVGSILQIENPHIKYVELTQHGFIILTMDQQKIQSDWFFVNTIDQVDPGYTWVKSLYSNDGQMTLLSASSAALAHPKYDQILAPECPRPFQNGTNDLQETFVDILGVYPNPAQSSLNVHFITGSNNQHIVKITDLKGKVLKSVVKQVSPFNSNIALIDVEELSDGVYLLVISDEKGNENKTLFVKE
jgi:alkaline phosphatase D